MGSMCRQTPLLTAEGVVEMQTVLPPPWAVRESKWPGRDRVCRALMESPFRSKHRPVFLLPDIGTTAEDRSQQ